MTISIGGKQDKLELTNPLTKGEDGGYYIPSVDASGELTWQASEEDMADVAGVNIKGPKGDIGLTGPKGDAGPAGAQGIPGEQGIQGEKGASGVWYGEDEPTEDYDAWIREDGQASAVVTYDQMVDYVQQELEDSVAPDLTNYPTKDEMNEAIAQAQPDLSDYALKSDIPEPVDLSDYALKSDIPSLDGYAKLEDIPEMPDLTDYALKTDIPSLDGYATEDYVTEAIAAAIPGSVQGVKF